MNPCSKKSLLLFLRRPLAFLGASGLLVTATSRTAYALVVALGLLWVYGLSALVMGAGKRLLPKNGRNVIAIVLASFLGSLYLLLVLMLNPVLGMSLTIPLVLVSVLCVDSGVATRFLALDARYAVFRALALAGFWGLLLAAFALVREPLGQATLSLPGGPGGVIRFFGKDSPFPVRAAATPAGALILLGYAVFLIRRFVPGSRRGEAL